MDLATILKLVEWAECKSQLGVQDIVTTALGIVTPLLPNAPIAAPWCPVAPLPVGVSRPTVADIAAARTWLIAEQARPQSARAVALPPWLLTLLLQILQGALSGLLGGIGSTP